MDLLDNLLDGFSAKELSTRVKGVVIGGVVLCAVIAFALFSFLRQPYQLTLNGAGQWIDGATPSLQVHLQAEELGRIAEARELTALLLDPQQGFVPFTCAVLSIDPQDATISLDASKIPKKLRANPAPEVRLLILELPIWRLLWGSSAESKS